MRHPQIICYESSGWLAGQIRRLAAESGWLIREPRDDAACLSLLDSLRPSVLLLEISRDEKAAVELMNHRLQEVRARAILVCLDHADEPWAMAALRAGAPHASAYVVKRD